MNRRRRDQHYRPPERYDISVEGDDGRTYTGTYTLSGSGYGTLVNVTSQFGTTKTTQLGNSPAEVIAGMLLSGLVREAIHRRGRQEPE
jgi:hypothetical protein